MIMDERSFKLKWQRHSHVLASNFSHMIAQKQFSDVTICTRNGNIPAHRLILSSCSQMFKELFDDLSSDNTQTNHPVIVVKDVDHDTMFHLLKFMYVGTVDVRESCLKALFDAGKQFRVQGLEEIAHQSNIDFNENEDSADDEGPEEVQRKELDLSRNGPTRQYSCPTSLASFAEERSTSIPNLLAAPPQKAHINPGLLNPSTFSPFDNAIFNTALAMRTTPPYISNQLNSPSRPNMSCPNLPRQSPQKSGVDSSRPSLEALHRENLSMNRRISNSPEGSAHSEASLDLTKASSNSPLNRLASVNPLSSLVSAVNTPTTQAELHAIASTIHQFQQMQQQPQIRVSQSLLNKRSRSRSPEPITTKMAKVERFDRDMSPGRYSTNNRGNSPHNSIHSNKQTQNNNNSSGGSSSEHNNYSDDDDDSGDEGRPDENRGGERSVSSGPSTSTPTAIQPGYGPLHWNYPPTGDDAITAAADPSTNSAGFWKNSFKNSLLGPYLSTSLPPLSPGTATLSPTFPGMYPNTPLSNWGSSSPPSLHSIPFLRSNECARCGRLYKTRKGLKHHIKNECGVEPRFQCTRCDWKFKQKAHLLRHMARKHTPPLTTSSTTPADPSSNGPPCLTWKNQNHASS